MFGQTLKSLVVFTVLAIGHLTLMADGAPVQIFKDETFPRLQAESQMGVRADVGDVDNDGDLDVIVANGLHTATSGQGCIGSQDFLLQINDGSGNFTDEASTRLPSSAFGKTAASAAILGDVDGDGDLDVFVVNGSSGGCISYGSSDFQNRLWINSGVNSGVFTDATANLPSLTDSSLHAAFGDVDGDGDLDILVGNAGWNGLGERNRILINNGSGVFTDETTTRLPAYIDATLAVALADLDADGDLDIVVANRDVSSYHRSYALRNNGAGSFVAPLSIVYLLYSGTYTDVAVADVDGVGGPDLLFAGSSSTNSGVHLFRNSGTGTFSYTPISLPGSHGLAVADADNDSDNDVFVTMPGAQHRLLLNNGAGSFTDATATDLPVVGDTLVARYATFADVNNDGGVDLYIPIWWSLTSQNQDRLLINTISSTEVDPDIDIKPGSDPNCFNINGRGVIPVAILGSDTFDVFQINQSSLLFAGLDLRLRGSKGPLCSFEDSNADGFTDLVCQFEDDPIAWSPGVSEATLEGKLMDETAFQGTDSICVVQ